MQENSISNETSKAIEQTLIDIDKSLQKIIALLEKRRHLNKYDKDTALLSKLINLVEKL
jgi:hypothetical protein